MKKEIKARRETQCKDKGNKRNKEKKYTEKRNEIWDEGVGYTVSDDVMV